MDYWRRQFRRFTQPILWKCYKLYLSKTRWYKQDGLSIKVAPSVFHPGLLFSTKILLRFLLQLDLQEKRLLELGAGSGLISAALSRAGAKVLATDINPIAIDALKITRAKNQLDFEIMASDLFAEIPPQSFDLMAINPPYFPQEATDNREKAFFCGANFEYFHQLFEQLPGYLLPTSAIYMILSDDCDIDQIQAIASAHHFTWKEVYREKVWGETNFIFEIRYSYNN